MCGCMKIWTINNFIYFYTLLLYSESCGLECDLRTSSPIVCKKPRLVDTQDTSEWIIDIIFNKYKTFSVLIYAVYQHEWNWENEKLCGNTTPEGRSVFVQFRVSRLPRVLI